LLQGIKVFILANRNVPDDSRGWDRKIFGEHIAAAVRQIAFDQNLQVVFALTKCIAETELVRCIDACAQILTVEPSLCHLTDLTKIKHKPFNLTGDENGYFDFVMPMSKDKIKFRFLTHGDIKRIEQIDKEENVAVKQEKLNEICDTLNSFIESDDTADRDLKLKLYEAKRNIKKWADSLNVEEALGYTHKLTNRLELSIVSVNGNTNREYIADYVLNLNPRDALSLRRYINENEPGLDFNVEVEKPESLGGGSMPVFLSLDEYIFLNIA
jgi:hypothetical protein